MKYLLISALLFPIFFTGDLLAQVAGDLDFTFGVNGIVLTEVSPYSGGGSSLLLQPDGKLVVATSIILADFSDIALVRYFNDGSIDSAFGEDGFAVKSISFFNDFPYCISLFPDGDILVACTSYENAAGSELNYAIVRFNSDGTVDTTFGDNGAVITDLGASNEYLLSSVIQPDNKILVCGSSGAMYTNYAILRYLNNGEADTTFNGTGAKIIDLGPDTESAEQVVLQTDTKIVVGGFSFNGTDRDFKVIRMNSDGSYDMYFGDEGIATLNYMDEWNTMNSLALQPDGKIVCGGYTGHYPEYDFMVARFHSDGTVDNSFSDDGVITTDIGSNNDIIKRVIIQPDGKIVAAGVHLPGGGYQYALTRYNTDGEPDISFGVDGIITTNLPGGTSEQLNDAIWQPDGKITCAGGGFVGDIPSITMARYFGRLQETCDSVIHHPADIDTIADADVMFSILATNDSVSYQWQTNLGLGWTNLFDAGQYSGVTNDTLTVHNITIANNNQYFRCILNSIDCTDTSDMAILIVSDNVQIEHTPIMSGNIIWPNPVSSTATLEYTLTGNLIISIYLYDMYGKKIKTFLENELQGAGEHTQSLALPETLAPGNYFVVIRSPEGKVNIHIVKQ